MQIHWFCPTLNGILYVLPTITYIETDAFLEGFPDRKTGKVTIVNFVWLYWATAIIFGFKQN